MSIEFRACCCLKPRTGALLAGVIDLVIPLKLILPFLLQKSCSFIFIRLIASCCFFFQLIGLLGIICLVLLHLGHFDPILGEAQGGTTGSGNAVETKNGTVSVTVVTEALPPPPTTQRPNGTEIDTNSAPPPTHRNLVIQKSFPSFVCFVF